MPAKRLLTLALSLGLLPAAAVRADTVWTSPITSEVTWAKADSPHTWGGDLNVNSGGVINVEAGAVVKMPSAGHLRINGWGQILAIGSSEDPIRIGGVSELAPGGTIWLDSSLPSEFRFCHFAYLERARISSQSPQGNHLFEHSIFRKFSTNPIELVDAPARILHCLFRDYPTDRAGVSMTCNVFTDDTCPTIWYNTFDRNGLGAWTPASINMGDYDFFRFNRVLGGIGIHFSADKWGRYQRFRVLDCDLGSASPSLRFSGYGSGYDGVMDGLSIERCTLSTLTNISFGIVNTTNIANNYWGTTNMETIATALFGGGLSTNAALPISTTNMFPQADVDDSDGGNVTRQADADLVKQAVVGLISLTPEQEAVADVDRNGVVDTRDALLIESYINGLMWKLPVP